MGLIIVESPTKARTISKFLGKNNKVMATKGHIRDLPKSRMGIDIDSLEPEYITIRGKGELLKELKAQAKKADNVLIATDNDREGEAIAWHVAKLLDKEGQKNRVVFNEITKKSIMDAIKKPREIDMGLVNSQQARRVIDRVVGYSISPLLWKKVKNKLSAGRVQSVALMLICKRENEINDFKPEEYWNLKASFDRKINLWFDLKQILENGKPKNLTINNAIETKKIEDYCGGHEYEIIENKIDERFRSPQSPYTTSLLQQDANRKLNFKATFTMQVAQSLYEGIKVGKEEFGLITYMRTDSRRIAPEAQRDAARFIKSKYGEEYYEGPKNYINKGKNTQDAHEAIRPTNVERTPSMMKKYLNPSEYKLYKLIWERFVASQMKKAKIETNRVTLKNGVYLFKSEANKLIFDGYMKVVGLDNSISGGDLKKYAVGNKLNHDDFKKEQLFTKPPARYTEASLIKTLESDGIGRPSTYAPTISTLLSRFYIELDNKSIKPTDLGVVVNSILIEYFPSILDVKFTANLEEVLDKIAVGREDWHKALREFYGIFEEDLKVAEDEIEKIVIEDEVSDVKCELCGRMMVIKQGPYGKFLACPGFPECKNTKSIEEKIGIKCPKCSIGDILKKKSKRGRVFYGCSRYPDCDFAVYDLPIDEKCPKCGSLLTEKIRAKFKEIKCTNCSYKEERPR